MFDVSWSAIAKVVAVLALIWAWLHLWQYALVLVVAMILAVVLHPVVLWLNRHRVPCGIGAFVVVLTVACVAAAVAAVSWVAIRDQSQLIIDRLSEVSREARAAFPALDYALPSDGGSPGLTQYAMAVARSITSAVGMVLLAFVLTTYLLVEWKRTLEWVVAFGSDRTRQRLRKTASEARTIMFRYAVGNVIASSITGVVTFIVLAALQVPAALMLAIISGVLNFIPVIGFLVSAAVALVLAATVSTNVLLLVAAFYLVFNAVENYLITPKVFGRELELSDLAVLLAVIVGAELGGVMGALLALPLAALYPTIERIWLRDHLGADTVEIHDRLSA